MSMRLDCFDLDYLTEDEELYRPFVLGAARGGKPVRAYTGIYANRWFNHLQIVAGGVIEGDTFDIRSADAHCAGNCIWACRIKEDVTPEGRSELSRRLLVSPLSDDEVEAKSFTVVEVMNAEVLPSYAPGEIIHLQVIAKAREIRLYPDGKSLAEAEGRKVMLPAGENGEKEEQTVVVAEGYPSAVRFMHNHFKKAEEEAEAAAFTEEDKWVYLQGEILQTSLYSAVFKGEDGHEDVRWNLPAFPVHTFFGDIDILFNPNWISEEKKGLTKAGNILSTVCEIQGDTLIDEYEKGMAIDPKNNLMAVRYAFSSGKMKRLLPVMAEGCRFYTDTHDLVIVGKEEIVKYLEGKYRHITEEAHCKTFTAYGYVINDEKETEQYGLKHRRGEPCVAIGLDDGEEKGWSQFVFLEYDEEKKIRGISMLEGEHYRFSDAFRSWVEMEKALKDEG